jgi:C4-dicarboxylate transporter DctM subunit
MTGIEHGMVIGALMLLLMALRIHIAMAMMLAGSIGYIWMTGSAPLLNYMKTAAWARYSIYDLSVVPLFLLMGQFATHGGLSRKRCSAPATR